MREGRKNKRLYFVIKCFDFPHPWTNNQILSCLLNVLDFSITLIRWSWLSSWLLIQLFSLLFTMESLLVPLVSQIYIVVPLWIKFHPSHHFFVLMIKGSFTMYHPFLIISWLSMPSFLVVKYHRYLCSLLVWVWNSIELLLVSNLLLTDTLL